MTKSIVLLLAAGVFAWAAAKAPGPPAQPDDFRVTQVAHHGRRLRSEPVYVRGWERNLLVHVGLAGCEPNAEGSVRAWVVSAGAAPAIQPRQDYSFKGSVGSVPCPIALPGKACRVVLCAEDQRGQRESRSFTVEPILQ